MTRYLVQSAKPWKNTGRPRLFCVADDQVMAELMQQAEERATGVDVVINPVDQLPDAGPFRTEAA